MSTVGNYYDLVQEIEGSEERYAGSEEQLTKLFALYQEIEELINPEDSVSAGEEDVLSQPAAEKFEELKRHFANIKKRTE